MYARLLLPALILAVLVPSLSAQSSKPKKDDAAFTLKNIFPKDGLFGPSASTPKFSHDGRHAVWSYRPYVERRHGGDLWLYDVRTDKVERVTSATVMARFEAESRKVVKDRVERAKKEQKKLSKKDKNAKKVDEKKLGDYVTEKDHKLKKAPRHPGVRSFTWSPTASEFLFVSRGDVYRYRVDKRQIERLTCTKDRESDVLYLPDGKGYTYMLSGGLRKVTFGSHMMQQVDPKLPSGETMTGYKLSPDGQKLVFIARKGSGVRTGKRTVKIARYTERFMEVREVPRHVSDDPMPKTENMVYLYDMNGAMEETNKPVLAYTHEISGPRDILRVPRWSPDSKKVVFSVFEQKSGHVNLLEAGFPDAKKEDPEKKKTAKKETEADEEEEEEEDDDEEKKAKKLAAAKAEADQKDEVTKHPAKVVYRFLHHGGPTTPRMMQPEFLSDSRRIVFLSEQTGFRHLHVLDPVYETQAPLTSGRFEVYPVRIAKDHESMYVSATREDSACLDVYRLDLNHGKLVRLTPRRGSYSRVAVGRGGKTVLANFAAFGSLRELVAVAVARRRQMALTSSHPEKTRKLTSVKPEFFTFENRHGQEIRGHVFKPKGLRKGDKRPLLIYVYGGPLGTRKQVTEGNFHADSYLFGQYMAREHGYVTCTIDPRGMSGYGGAFEKANFENVGKPQVEDLVDGVKYMIKTYGIDPERVGIHGWSFGGFQTQMCMYTAPEAFKVGIAGAGPTEWENYNSWYSTGTIGKSRTGTPDLKKYSLLPLAKKLQGKLLLVHGMEDSNVLYQDTVRVYRELLKAGKETLVELFLDPTGGHGLGGDVQRLNRARKYEEFLVRNLGTRKKKPSKRPRTDPSPNREER